MPFHFKLYYVHTIQMLFFTSLCFTFEQSNQNIERKSEKHIVNCMFCVSLKPKSKNSKKYTINKE